jgi:hypothetical protein
MNAEMPEKAPAKKATTMIEINTRVATLRAFPRLIF